MSNTRSRSLIPQRIYERHGFSESPIDPMMLLITIAEAKRALGTEGDYPRGRESP